MAEAIRYQNHHIMSLTATFVASTASEASNGVINQLDGVIDQLDASSFSSEADLGLDASSGSEGSDPWLIMSELSVSREKHGDKD